MSDAVEHIAGQLGWNVPGAPIYRNHHRNASLTAPQISFLTTLNKWDLLLYNKLREAETLCTTFSPI